MTSLKPTRRLTGDPADALELTVDWVDACIAIADDLPIKDRCCLHLARGEMLGIELTDAYLAEIFGISKEEASAIFGQLYEDGFWEWR